MKLRKKTLFSIVLTLAMMVAMCIAMGSTAYAAEQSWKSGDCTVTLNDDGVMTVSGTGNMADYTGNDPYHGGQPWGRIKNDVKTLVIEEGVTGIGENGFCYHQNLSTVKLPSTIKSIGWGAFVTCADPTNLYIKAAEPPELTTNTFFGFEDAIIYVQHDYVDKYKSHKYWGQCRIYDLSDYVHIPETRYTATEGGVIEITAEVAPDNAPLKWSVTRDDAQVKLYSDKDCVNEIGADYTDTVVYAKSAAYGPATVKVEKANDSKQSDECSLSFNPVAGVMPANAGKVSVYTDWYGSTKWCVYMAEPADGYVFSKWEYESNDVDSEKITEKKHALMSEDGPLGNVVARFIKPRPADAVDVALEPVGSGEAYVYETEVNGEQHYEYVAVPNDGYEFVNWTYKDQYGDEPEKEYTTSDNPFNNIPVAHGLAKDMVAHFQVAKKEQTVTAPAPVVGLTYTGEPQALVTPAEVTDGNKEGILYLLDEEGASWSTDIPKATEAGRYEIHYKVKGNDEYDTYIHTEPIIVVILPAEAETPSGLTAKVGQRLSEIALPENWAWVDDTQIVGEAGTNTFKANYTAPDKNHASRNNVDITVKIDLTGQKLVLAKASVTYNGKGQRPAVKTIGGKALKVNKDFTLAIKNSKGKAVTSPKAAGKYTVTITGKDSYAGTTKATFTILKAKNTLKVSGKTIKISKKKVKKKAQVRSVTKVIKFTKKGQGKKNYKLISAKKGKKNFRKKFAVNAKTGKLTVKKKLEKGTYKVRVKVTAKGTANYKAAAKTVTITVKVK